MTWAEGTPEREFYDRAVEMYGSVDIDVLSTTVDITDDGAWVAALLWVPKETP